MIHHINQFASVISDEGQRLHPARLRGLYRCEDIVGHTSCRDGDNKVDRLKECVDLPGEDVLVTIVVRNSGHYGCIVIKTEEDLGISTERTVRPLLHHWRNERRWTRSHRCRIRTATSPFGEFY